MPDSKKILLAVDSSKASQRTAAYVADMIADKSGLHVGLFHVVAAPRMLEWAGSEDPEIEDRVEAQREQEYQQSEEELREREKGLLEEMQLGLLKRGLDVAVLPVKFEDLMDRKHVARDILKMAKEGDYGTIAVGRHSFSGLQRLFKHHVGEELVRQGKGITIWVVE